MAKAGDHASESFRIRTGGAEDLDAVLALWHNLDSFQRDWRVFTPRSTIAREAADMYRAALRDPGVLVAVAEESGEVVGTAYGHTLVPSSFSDERAVELSGMIVRPSHRGRGIGRALTAEVARFAGRLGIRYVTVKTFAQNEDGLEFWRRVGFAPRMVQMVAPADQLGSLR